MAVYIPASSTSNYQGLNQAGSNNNNPTTSVANSLNNAYLSGGDIGPLSAQQVKDSTAATSSSDSDNHPIKSASGQWVSSTTGQAWHGSYQNPNGSTQYFSNGQQVGDIGQVGTQTPNISVQQIQKNPAVSSQVAGAVAQNGATQGLMSKSFNDYLTEASGVAAKVPGQLNAAEQAINPTGTINRMNTDVSGVKTDLGNTLNQYTGQQQQNQQNIAEANTNYKTTQDAALAGLGTTLNNQEQQYETAAQGVADQAYAAAGKATNLGRLTSSTPTSNSGAVDNRLIGAYENINVPLQQQLAQQRMAITNQLYNTGSNLQNQYLGNLQTQYAGQGALNTGLATMANQNNQYTAGLDLNTAQGIQQLQQTVAQMQPQLALSYLQSMGIPMQTAQQITAGNTSNLAGLTSLDQNANSYNMYQPYQNNAPQYTVPGVQMPQSVRAQSGNNTATNGATPAQIQQLIAALQSGQTQPQTATATSAYPAGWDNSIPTGNGVQNQFNQYLNPTATGSIGLSTGNGYVTGPQGYDPYTGQPTGAASWAQADPNLQPQY